MKWIDVNEDMPFPYDIVYVAGEMKYDYDNSVEYFTDTGWLNPQYMDGNHPDWRRWTTDNDWYEGQEYFKITHWAELPELKHPKL